MPVSEPRLDPAAAAARRSNAVVWAIIALLALVFAGLTAYQIIVRQRDEIDPNQLRELANAAPRPAPIAENQSEPDWAQWRGPNRDGVSTETGLLTDWPTDGPKALWTKPTGGGYSSVVVARGCAFTMVQDGANEAVVCWDAANGKERWRFKYPAHFPQPYGDGPRSTPSVVGEHIYAVGGTGIMHCLKAFTTNPAGELVWRRNLLADFGGPLLKWGTSFSPLVDKGLVFVVPGGPGLGTNHSTPNGSLAALDKETGAVVWQKFDDLPSYSSPVAADLAGQRQIVFLTGERLLGVVPETGTLLWEFPWSEGPGHTPNSIVTPLVIHLDVGDYIFLSSGYANGCALVKIVAEDGVLRAKQAYRNGNMRSIFSSCVRHGDFVYGFDDSNLKCLELRTGTMKWKKYGFGKGSVSVADGHLIIFGDGGTLALAAADPQQYREVACFEHSDKPSSWSVPTWAGGRLYVRDRTRLVCYDLKKSP